MKLSKRQQTKNHNLMMDLIHYLQKNEMFIEINIYTNGHRYSSEKHQDAVAIQTPYGVYYDYGKYNAKLIEFSNPERLTMTFEGPFYDLLNYDYGGEEFERICEKHNMYFEQGYMHSLACYDN